MGNSKLLGHVKFVFVVAHFSSLYYGQITVIIYGQYAIPIFRNGFSLKVKALKEIRKFAIAPDIRPSTIEEWEEAFPKINLSGLRGYEVVGKDFVVEVSKILKSAKKTMKADFVDLTKMITSVNYLKTESS
jgi:hypothetical protein